MAFKTLELINILFSAFVGGLYWGPWLALTISLKKFDTKTFLDIVKRLNQNMAPLMTVLSPLSLLINLLVLIFSYNQANMTPFYLNLFGFLFFLTAVIVTVMVEVPIVKQIVTWTATNLPANWEQLRDKWGKFHVVRVLAGVAGLVCLLMAAVFYA